MVDLIGRRWPALQMRHGPEGWVLGTGISDASLRRRARGPLRPSLPGRSAPGQPPTSRLWAALPLAVAYPAAVQAPPAPAKAATAAAPASPRGSTAAAAAG